MADNSQSSYRSIFKATSLFGGVQVYQILVQVIKSKFIAILLGPEGVGIQGLLMSATDLVKQLTSFGLAQSAVRDVSEANGTGDKGRVNRTVTVLRKLVWLTGLLGTITVLALSPVLSKSTFGNYDYTLPLIFLSVTLLLDQLCAGQKVVLQGLRRLKDLAKATALGSTIGLIVCVPLYYLLGIRGIVPTLILNSVTALLLSWYFSQKVKIEKIQVTPRETIQDGKQMLRMGIAMSISSIMTVAASYILRSFIRAEGGTEAVGIFTAGFAIINTYVGMIFTAMSTDFYPRLAAVNKDNAQCRDIVNQQGEIGALIMAPLLITCIVFMPFVITLLYSERFIAAYDYILFAAFGMMLRFASVLIAHLYLAKGSSKLYIINEIAVCLYMLLFNLIGYKYGGLRGLGISYILTYSIYLIQVFTLTHKHYEFSFSTKFLRVYGTQMILVVSSMFCFLLIHSLLKYVLGVLLISISGYFAIKGLDERMNLFQVIKSRINR